MLTKLKVPNVFLSCLLVGGHGRKSLGTSEAGADHEATKLTFLVACVDLNEAMLCSGPNSFLSEALVIIRGPRFFSQRASGQQGSPGSGKSCTLNPRYLIHIAHRPHCRAGIVEMEAMGIFLAHSFHQERITGQQKQNLVRR